MGVSAASPATLRTALEHEHVGSLQGSAAAPDKHLETHVESRELEEEKCRRRPPLHCASMAHLQLPEIVTEEGYWGPPSGASAASVLADEFQQIPFAPFSKNERIGRIADWNSVGTSGCLLYTSPSPRDRG